MSLTKVALALVSAVVLSSTAASAAIVCNDEGDCWRVKKRYEYKPEFRLHVYDDNWRWGRADRHKYRWREARGRGYWRQGVWVTF